MTKQLGINLVITARENGVKRLLSEHKRAIESIDKAKREQSRRAASYEALGIRSEREIQREIRRTEAAYRRLAASGRASQNDLARAATASKEKIAQLNEELKKGEQHQSRLGSAMGKMGRGAATAFAAGSAAYATVAPEVERYKSLDLRLRETTWAAYGQEKGEDKDFLTQTGLPEIRALIREMVSQNGGSVDVAVDVVQGMLANGLEIEQVKREAVTTHSLALAAGENGQADGGAAAKLAQVFSSAGYNVERASQMAVYSGMQGTFEIADMVRHLPSLLPDAKAAGFVGDEGLGFLLSGLQSASAKSGSNDEAATMMKNMLQKMTAADTTKRMDKLLEDDGKNTDWRQMVIEGQREGKNAVQVLSAFAQNLLEQDKAYQDAKQRAAAGDENAKQEAAMMQAFLVSKLLPDMRARGGLNAMIDDQMIQGLFNELMGFSGDVIGAKNAFMNEGAHARQEKADALKAIDLQESSTFESLVEAQTQFKSLAAEFPVATEALKALAAAASAAALAQGVMSVLGGGKTGALGKIGGVLSGGSGAAGTGLGAVGGGFMVYSGSSTVKENANKGFFDGGMNSRASGYAQAAAGGALTGAAIGSMVPVIGTALGAAVGGVFGTATAAITDWLAKDSSNESERAAQLAAQSEQTVNALAEQSAVFQAALEADTAQVGGKLDTINSTLGGLNQTIQNNVSLSLDGRVIANEISRHQVAMFARGAAL